MLAAIVDVAAKSGEDADDFRLHGHTFTLERGRIPAISPDFSYNSPGKRGTDDAFND